jgi:hypothetical protein
MRLCIFIILLIENSSCMPPSPLKVGDKLTFQWKPGYRGPLRDGETVYVVAIEEQTVKVCYRLKQEATLRPELLYR